MQFCKPIILTGVIVGLLGALPGCGDGTSRGLSPDQFAAAPSNRAEPAESLDQRLDRPDKQSADQSATGSTPQTPPTQEPAPEAQANPQTTNAQTPPARADDSRDAETYAVGGMVGQVNGQAIYAHSVFRPLHEQMQALGRKLAPQQFTQRAQNLIASRVRSLVIDRLILGEAMRDLSEREQKGLERIIQNHREELLRRYGRGSEAVAARTIREQTGKSLDQTLQDFRRKAVVQRYLKKRLLPRVSVSRQDIEHHYNTRPEQYQPGISRKIHLIRIASQGQAQTIKQALKSGRSFKKLARREANKFNASNAGLLGTETGNAPLRAPLNEVLKKLKQGDWGGPVETAGDYWFVYCDQLDKREGQSLRDVQLKIRNKLRAQRYRQLQQQYRKRLLQEGSYTSIEDMTRELVSIAVSRYATPAKAAADTR
jgi:hypothetical protein